MIQPFEEIIVAYNSQPEGSPTEYLGAEISIGYLTREKIDELTNQLKSKTLFEEFTGLWGGTFKGSSLLQDFMNINDIYHKNGLIYYEDIYECNDTSEYSTSNWYRLSEEYYDNVSDAWMQDPDYQSPETVRVPENGMVVLSIRTMDLYFKATGLLQESLKTDRNIEGVSAFKVRLGIDSFHTLFSGFNFSGFNLLHTASVVDIGLTRDEESETESGNIYCSTHLIFKDGVLMGWLGTHNEAHGFPFNHTETDMPCISPYLSDNDPENYQMGVQDLLQKLSDY
jgi:hypothetical protein